MPQIALVPHQHNHNIDIRVVPQFLQPAVDVLVGLVLCNVINEERANSTSVVSVGFFGSFNTQMSPVEQALTVDRDSRASDSPITLLTRRIPNLRLDGLSIHLYATRSKLHTNS